MDSMFTLQHQQFHHQSFNSTVTSSTSSRSSTDHQATTNYHHRPPEDCFNTFFMEEDDFSCSSSMQYFYSSNQFQPPTSTTPQPSKSQGFSFEHDIINFSSKDTQDIVTEFSNSICNNKNSWRRELLLEAARAMADNNSSRLHQLMWMLNELSSPYGDIDEKLSSYFLQALYTRMTNSGPSRYQTLSSISKNKSTFESNRDLVLKFQEVNPWTTFGHVASNGAIMEAFEGETKLHIIDINNTYSTQWPTLLETIATRSTNETPHLRLTTIITTNELTKKINQEIVYRMEKFARLMGVPFEFNVIHHSGDLSNLDYNKIIRNSDEVLAINLNGTLRSVTNHRRDYLISIFRNLNPKIMTIVEEEADFDMGYNGLEFIKGFEECLRWFRVYFESLDESFPKTSNERLILEREAGRAVVDLVACSPENSVERREKAERWSSRLRGGGFEGVSYSEDGVDDLWALLRRYRDGWSTAETVAGMFLMWKETPVVWASAWKPIRL